MRGIKRKEGKQMKVTKLGVVDFMGLRGTYKYDTDAKRVAVCAPNGTGKTSFLSALRYALTGAEPAGEIINKGAVKAIAQAGFSNGDSVARTCFTDKPAKYAVNGKRSSLGELNNEISLQAGMPISQKAGRIISSAEAIAALNSKDLGDLLMAYLPEEMTAEMVMEKVPDLTEKQKEILGNVLPEGTFRSDVIDRAANLFIEKRREYKGLIREGEVLYKRCLSAPVPQMPKEDAEAALKDLSAKRDKALLYAKSLAAYNQALEAKAYRDRNIALLKTQIEAIHCGVHTDDEKASIEREIKAHESAIVAARGAISAMEANGRTLKRYLKAIDDNVCPIHKKIVCRTDKSGLRAEMQRVFDTIQSQWHQQKEHEEEEGIALSAARARLAAVEKDMADARRLAILKEQLKSYENSPAPAVEKPSDEDAVPVAEIDRQIASVKAVLSAYESIAQAEPLRASLEQNKAMLAAYESLADSFSPKGIVKREIMKHYMDEFSDPCTSKMEKLFPGMKIRFEAEDGVQIYADPKGTGQYISFRSLSGAEKACVIFVVMTMLASLSGFRILILDEFTTLDDRTAQRLLQLIADNEDEYDQCFVAAVDHEGTDKLLTEAGFTLLDVTK